MENLTQEERKNLENIISDLQILFEKEHIDLGELDNLKKRLKSKEVFNYLRDLREGSKPETALREELLAGNSILANFLFGKKSPEVTTSNGFIDYKVKVANIPILVELKPLFTPRYGKEGNNTVLKDLKRDSLNWEEHKEQLEKYLRENEFLILTNLKNWYFFSKRAREPIKETAVDFDEFYKEFRRTANLKDYLERFEESHTIRGDLDKHFFNNLETWVSALSSVKFKSEISEEEKLELIIKLINKFIFIQTLDDHYVIDFHWIRANWEEKERKWQQMGKRKVLSEFLGEVNEWFYAHYDTELFRIEDGKNILNCIEENNKNISKFYNKLKRILGLEHWQRATSVKGIVNYDYKRIDEDIFGKAYETYLAEVRKKQGIYYTPKSITQYIVEETVGKKFDEHLDRFKKALEKENYQKAKKELYKIINIKVIDPACGSGSFLIKAIRAIWNRYAEIFEILLDQEKENAQEKGTFLLPDDKKERLKKIRELLGILDYRRGTSKRELMSKLILRHIFGNDLDAKALSVAKVNIWLAAIKLIPSEYRYDRINQSAGHSLPDLEINLGHGDSLIYLPENTVIEYLKENYQKDLEKISELRNSYLENPRDENFAKQTKTILSKLSEKLDEKFKSYIQSNNLPTQILEITVPTYWPLQFWHAYLDDNLEEVENPGFECVIGNPPYINAIERRGSFTPQENEYWHEEFDSSKGAYDIYVLFLELGIKLAQNNGLISFIVPNKHLSAPYAEAFRNFIMENDYYFKSITNVSQLDVFEDPNVYPVIPLYEKVKPPENATITINSPPSKSELGNNKYNHTCQYSRLNELAENLWSFLLLDDATVFWKIYERCQPLKKEGTVQASSTTGEAEKFTEAISESKPTDTKKRFIKTGDIDPFLCKWEFKPVRHQGKDYRKPVLNVDHKVVSDLRKKQYNKAKLIFAKVASFIEGFPDVTGDYASVDTNFLYDTNRSITYYGGILNSKVANFLYSALFSALRMSGGDFQFQAPQLKLIPIPQNNDKSTEEEISECVAKIMTKKKIAHVFTHIWETQANKLKNTERSLATILKSDRKALQRGNREKLWTSHVSFYPGQEKEELEKEFTDFRFIGDPKEPIISIYGIERQKEEKIYEIKFANRDLMQIVYLSLIKLFNSRKKVKYLNDIFTKTMIPIVQPNIKENTPNILREIEDKFNEWQDTQDHNEQIDLDLIKIEKAVQEINNQIDAQVFNLYELDREEVITILDSLGTRESVKNDILSRFDKLK